VDVMVCVGVRECVGMNVFVKRGHRNIPFHCLLDQSPTEQISFYIWVLGMYALYVLIYLV